MGDGEGRELGFDQPVAPIVEALEVTVVFDLAEDGLRFHGAFAPMLESGLAHESLPGPSLQLVVPVVHLYGAPVGLPFVAQPSQRTARAVPGAVDAHFVSIAKFRDTVVISDVRHVLTHGAHVVVFVGIVEQVLGQEGIVSMLPLLLGMEHRVLD